MRILSGRLPIRGRGYALASRSCGPLACNAYALVCGSTGEAAVVDPSFSTPCDLGALESFLEAGGATAVTRILLTHGHPDHVEGVSELTKAWPGASLSLHPLEAANYEGAKRMGRDLFGMDFPNDGPLPAPTHALEDGQVLAIGSSIELSVVHTPGHSPGHVAFADRRTSRGANQGGSESDKGRGAAGSVLLSGDLLFQGSVGRTDFHNSSLDDLYAR